MKSPGEESRERTESGELLPEWKCERYLLGELDEGEMERIRLRAERDGGLRARLAELERSDREIRERYPAAMMARRIESRLATAERRAVTGPSGRAGRRAALRRGRLPRLAWIPAAAVALVAGVLWLNPSLIPGSSWPDAAGVRVKGPEAVLSLYRRTADGSERLESGAVAAEHDLIGARYRSGGDTYAVIVSVDGRGVVTRHLPVEGGEAVRLAAGSHPLDFSYELDDAPRWEIFLLAASRSAFALDALLGAIEASPLGQGEPLPVTKAEEAARGLVLPGDVSISVVTLIKEAGNER